MRKRNLVIMITIFVLAFTVCAKASMDDMKNDIINEYWKVQTLLYDMKTGGDVTETEYVKATTTLDNKVETLIEYVIDNDLYEEFSIMYQNLPKGSENAFSEVVQTIIEKNGRSDELFPGYGYADPGYYYRLGMEQEQELLQKFWKSEERTMEKNKKHKFYIELKLAQSMQQSAEAGGKIEGFDIKGVFGMEINGEIKQVAETEFSTKETLRTKCVVAYEKNKVWYELLKAKKGFWDWLPWNELKWEKAGKTYKIQEEATDTEVIIEPPTVSGVPSIPVE
jgi:hypothetical protein